MTPGQCNFCLNYLSDRKCLAFDLIPSKYFTGEVEHITIDAKQNLDFVFEEWTIAKEKTNDPN